MVEINDLSFGYARKENLYEQFSIHFKSGQIYGLLGQNGSGKSTLMKIIAGLIYPDSGNCVVNGINSKERNYNYLRNLYIIPEEFDLPDMTIASYVRIYAPFYEAFSADQFETCLKEFEISPEEKLQKLSYGNKKKVLLSFGLATNVRVLLLDEPTNGLDIPSKKTLRKLIAAAATPERCFIISTHQVHDLENLLDHLVVISKNKLLLNESISTIAQKICFVPFSSRPAENETLYYEKSFTGHIGIVPNNSNEEGKINLEVLFNGIVAQQAKFSQLFKPNK
ncbi:MAG: ABC transporter ATP-binding protein [Bacteroidales bacterium]|nr:ABC transporter ATP-binding protein [Bacteroidales bacterium]MDD4821367.1 ABC transporter ATP-binding protein [Bacteroidales bacterium]